MNKTKNDITITISKKDLEKAIKDVQELIEQVWVSEKNEIEPNKLLKELCDELVE